MLHKVCFLLFVTITEALTFMNKTFQYFTVSIL